MKAHQAMLEPLSPKLSTMFQQHNCCNCSGSYCGRREAIQIHLPDIQVETMKCLLHVIYSGKAYLRKYQAEDIEGLMNLLDMKFQEMKTHVVIVIIGTIRTSEQTGWIHIIFH